MFAKRNYPVSKLGRSSKIEFVFSVNFIMFVFELKMGIRGGVTTTR